MPSNTITLNNGVQMPALGLGVFQTPPDVTTAVVEQALRLGYRHIDTAAAYLNEREVGEGIRRCGVPRDDVFVETKVWISDYGYDATLHAFDKSAGRRWRSCSPTARCAPSASATSCPSTSTGCSARRPSCRP